MCFNSSASFLHSNYCFFTIELLRERGREIAKQKKNFLPEHRTSMINDEETNQIILSAFKYVFALQELIQTYLNFFISHYVYNDFKGCIDTFPREISNHDWSKLIPNDSSLDDSISALEDRISESRGQLVMCSKCR